MKVESIVQDQLRSIRSILRALDNRVTAEDNLAPDGIQGQVLASRGPNLPPSWQDLDSIISEESSIGEGTPGHLAMWLDEHTLTDAPVTYDGLLRILVDAEAQGILTVLGNTVLGDSSTDTIDPIARFINHLIPKPVILDVDVAGAAATLTEFGVMPKYLFNNLPTAKADLEFVGTFRNEPSNPGSLFTDYRIMVRGRAGATDPFNNSVGEYNFFRIFTNGTNHWDVYFYYQSSGGIPQQLGSGGFGPGSAPDGAVHDWRFRIQGLNFEAEIDGVVCMSGSFVDNPLSPLLPGGLTTMAIYQDFHDIPRAAPYSQFSVTSITELGETIPTYDIGTENIWWRRGCFEDLSVNGINYEWPSIISPGFVLMTDIDGNLRWGKLNASDISGIPSALDGPEGPEGPMGPVGRTGDRGLQGIQGITGAEGAEGPEGVMGPMGPKGDKGDKGDRGFDGLPGEDGQDGMPGAPGPVGPQGPIGLQGMNGVDGEDGAPGTQGPSGPAGAAGADGLTGPAGTTGPAGRDGEDGADGLPGPTGAAGPAGSTGATGPAGTSGPAGIDGDDGQDGVAGPTGPMGPQGIQGFTGLDGLDGEDGRDGLPGIAGPQGPQGPIGPPGLDGEDGEQGPPGSTGATGATGASGADGLTGPAGLMGPSGWDGEDGMPGPPGPIGPTGVAGATGPAGTPGMQGNDGEDGQIGMSMPLPAAGYPIYLGYSNI